jgi:ubiquinone/menaquinone biosynthesis C-methylase UbiE
VSCRCSINVNSFPVLFQALFEAYRVLKPGGRFLCLEFSHVANPVMGPLYELYSFQAKTEFMSAKTGKI